MEGNSITKDHLKYYYTHLVSSCENASVRIPVDQWANDSLMKLLPIYQDQISSMLISRKQTSNQIALHMRRGDVSATSSTSLYMPDHRYIHAIQSLNSQYPLDWPICIYSEGSRKQFFAFAQRLRAVSGRDIIFRVSESSFCTNPIEDFLDMISSIVLLCSYSTYAYCAIYFSDTGAPRYFLADNRSIGSEIYMLQVLENFGTEIMMPAER